MAEYMQSYANPQWRHDVCANLDRLKTLVEYLETQNVIDESNPAFDEMCQFYSELTQVYWNLDSLIPR